MSSSGEAVLSLSTFPVAGDWKSCLLWEQMAASPPILSGVGRQPKPSLKEQSVTCSEENRKEHFFSNSLMKHLLRTVRDRFPFYTGY